MLDHLTDQVGGGAEPNVSAAEERIENPGKNFCVRSPKSVEKRAFSANECRRAPRPRRLRLTKSHQQREPLRADHVQGVAQVKSAGAHWGVDCERAKRSFFELEKV